MKEDLQSELRTSFWTYFSSCFGTLFLLILAFSFLTQSYVDTGLFGLVGFPLISIIYAAKRRSLDTEKLEENSDLEEIIPPRMIDFLKIHPEFINSPRRLRDTAFHRWVNNPTPE